MGQVQVRRLLTGAVKEKEEKGAENKNGAEIGASNDSKGNLGATEEIKLAQTHLGDLGSWEFAITPRDSISRLVQARSAPPSRV